MARWQLALRFLYAAAFLAGSACDSKVPVGSPVFRDASVDPTTDGGSGGRDAGGDPTRDGGIVGLDAGGRDGGATDGGSTDGGTHDGGSGQPLPPGVVPGTAAPWPGLIEGNNGHPAAMAFDGQNHVVVWTDSRTNALMAARVSPSGALLDPAGLVLRADAPPQVSRGQVAIAHSGNQFLVLFLQITLVNGRADIRLAGIRLDPNLVPLDTTPIAISARAAEAPAAIFDGTQYVVAWLDSGGPRLARIDTNGTVLDPNGLIVENNVDAPAVPLSLAQGDGVTAIAWSGIERNTGRRRALIRRFSGDGTFADPAPVEMGLDTQDNQIPAIAGNGTDFLVTWMTVSGQTRFVRAARIGSTGDPVGLPPEIELEVGQSELTQASPTPEWVGNEWQVFLTPSQAAPRAHRIATDGTVTGAADLPITGNFAKTLLSFDGQALLWIARNFVDGRRQLEALRFDTMLTPMSTTPLAIIGAAPAQRSVTMASSPAGALVAWREYSALDLMARAALVDASGQTLAPAPIELSTNTAQSDGLEMAVVFNGTDYLVVWLQDPASGAHTAYATRVTTAGTVLDPGGFPVAVRVDDIRATSTADGTAFVCFTDVARHVFCSRIDRDGNVVDLNGGIDVSGERASHFAVGTVGDDFFVAWQVVVSGEPGLLKVRSVDPSDLTMSPVQTVSSEVHWNTQPSFGSGETEGQLVWAHRPMGASGPVELRAAVVTPAGFVGNVESIAAVGRHLQAAWSGTDWLITWLDFDSDALRSEIGAIRRLPMGGALAGAPFVVDRDRAMEPASIVSTSAGELAAYSRFVVDPRLNNRRARVIAVP
ncbi:MAG: hypothetical protein RIT81_33645 [Deltaproteobacteria bacterium]